jgi:O-antigen/teichoic acid export membrane protein
MVTRLGRAAVGAQQFAGLLRLSPFDSSTEEGRSQERHRRVLLSAIAGAAAKLVSVATALISIPLTLNYIGPERYGMWMTISSLVTMFAFADLGMGHGILNVVAQSSGTEDRQAIRQVVSSGCFVLSIIAIVVLVAFAAVYPFVSWFEIFNVKSELARLEAGPALAAAVTCFALAIPLGVASRVQMGLQQVYAVNLWRCLGSVLGLAGVLIAIWLKSDLTWLVIALLGGPLIASLINTVHFFKGSEPDLAPKRSLVSRSMVARIASIGFLFFGIQIAMAVAFTSDNLVIAQILGAEAVTQYAVPDKMFSVIGVVASMVLFPLWPAYGEAVARGDHTWVRKTLLNSLAASVVTTGLLSSILVIFGARLVELWTGSTIDPPFTLLLGLGLWRVLEAAGNAVSMLLNGANLVRYEFMIGAVTAVLAITLKLILTPRIGIPGVVWATIIANIVAAPAIFFLVRKSLS